MKTYWDYCQDEYPLGSKWRDKDTGTVYAVKSLNVADSLTVIVCFVSEHSARYLPASSVYAEMERI
jgi:hypothetical protein